MQEIVVDSFAGGGGTSCGLEDGLGHPVDIAINHDPVALAMYKVNHPGPMLYCENVWDVNPRDAVAGRPVGLFWLSPDCKHFSKAKGGRPVEKHIRGLAWIALRWAATVKPRVIMLENVEEFKTWGPLLQDGKPDQRQKGRTFKCFLNALERQGYKYDYRELKACDYGAPTIRKRFFLVARCDGLTIVWPEPTHGDPKSAAVKSGKLLPWRTAAEIIDWSLPCPSIFERKRPLAENTMKRIARGIQKFVIDNPKPFIVKVNHKYDQFRGQGVDEPMQTVTAKNGWGVVSPFIARIGQTGFGEDRLQYPINDPLTTIVGKAEHLLVTPVMARQYGKSTGAPVDEPLGTVTIKDKSQLVAAFLSKYHGEKSVTDTRGQMPDEPIRTLDTSNRFSLATAFLMKYYEGGYKGPGASLNGHLPTVTTKDHNALVTSHLVKLRGICKDGQSVTEPMPTITAGRLHVGEVRAFLTKFYGTAIGQACDDPLQTITTKHRFGLVTVQGQDYQIVDIGMRMLEPRELFRAQGFSDDYIIDHDVDGNRFSKATQVAKCGNSVPPVLAEALVRANLPDMCGVQDRRENDARAIL
jgi:DNA (cytosine-5)-methyltransferase 1